MCARLYRRVCVCLWKGGGARRTSQCLFICVLTQFSVADEPGVAQKGTREQLRVDLSGLVYLLYLFIFCLFFKGVKHSCSHRK